MITRFAARRIRVFPHLSVAPVGRAVAAELGRKLEVAGFAFDRSGLMAADVASKARAFQALTAGGMDAGAAAAAAGLDVRYGANRVLL